MENSLNITSAQGTHSVEKSRWSFLVEASKVLNSTLETDKLLVGIMELSSRAVGAEAVSLAVVDEKLGDLFYEFALGKLAEESEKIRVPISEGIVGWVARTGKPALVNDVSADKRFSGFIDRRTGFHTTSILAVPLARQGIVRGVLVARNKNNGATFTDKDLEIFSALAEQVTIALANSQLYQEARKELRQRMVLCDVGKLITSSLDLEKVLSLIIDALRHVIPYDAAGIFLIDPKSQKIEEESVRGYDPQMSTQVHLKVGDGIMGWAAKAGKGMIVPDVSREPQYVNARPQTRSEMAAPLKSGDRVIGIFDLESDQLNAYDEHDLDLLTAFASQAAIAIVNARLFKQTLEMHRLEHDLTIAREIQSSYLPQEQPQLKGYDLVGMNVPSEEVGGDYFDFISVSEGQLGLAIADVSGKGISGGLIMASFRASLLAEIRNNYAIKDICAKVNALLWESTAPDRYVTACYGVLDLKKRIFTYANAGHNPPIVLSSDGRYRRLDVGGLPLGFLKNATYREEAVHLRPGDSLILYTDGVTEAQDEQSNEFGEERLVDAVRRHRHLSAKQLQSQIYQEVRAFASPSGVIDDVTIVILKILT